MPIDFDKATLTWSLPWDADWVTAVCFLGDHRVAAGNNLGQILVWDLPDKADAPAPLPSRQFTGHTNVISRLLATPDAKTLLSASYDHSIRCWDLQASAGASVTLALNARTRDDLLRRRASKVPAPVEA